MSEIFGVPKPGRGAEVKTFCPRCEKWFASHKILPHLKTCRVGGTSRYGASKRTKHAGFSFGSKLEAAVYELLVLRERAGELRDIALQQHVYLTAARIDYIADFSYFSVTLGKPVWVEAKGLETPVWRIKRRLWQHYGPGKLEVWKGDHKRPVFAETITPLG